MNRFEECAKWLMKAEKIVVLTGAGMSTESGIPDFRSSKGLYSQDSQKGIPLEEVLSHSFFKRYPKKFYQFYREKLLYPDAQPNEGHYFLSQLEDQEKDVTIITQNIDGLHQKAGSQKVLELHGSTRQVVDRSGIAYSTEEVTDQGENWLVADKWVRPDIVLYGERLKEEVIAQSVEAVRQADCLLVMGTSLNVYPAAGLVFDFTGERSILVNKGTTPLDHFFSQVFLSSISEWASQVERYLNQK